MQILSIKLSQKDSRKNRNTEGKSIYTSVEHRDIYILYIENCSQIDGKLIYLSYFWLKNSACSIVPALCSCNIFFLYYADIFLFRALRLLARKKQKDTIDANLLWIISPVVLPLPMPLSYGIMNGGILHSRQRTITTRKLGPKVATREWRIAPLQSILYNQYRVGWLPLLRRSPAMALHNYVS